MPTDLCAICDQPAAKKYLCSHHYQQYHITRSQSQDKQDQACRDILALWQAQSRSTKSAKKPPICIYPTCHSKRPRYCSLCHLHYNWANRDHINLYNLNYRIDHYTEQQERDYLRQWREKNPDRWRAIQKKYYSTATAKAKANLRVRRRRLAKKIESNLLAAQQLYREYLNTCLTTHRSPVREPRSHKYQYQMAEIFVSFPRSNDSPTDSIDPLHTRSLHEPAMDDHVKDIYEQLIIRIIQIALSILTKSQREVFFDHFIFGMTQHEIAKKRNICQSSVVKSLVGNTEYSGQFAGKTFGGSIKRLSKFLENDTYYQSLLKQLKSNNSE